MTKHRLAEMTWLEFKDRLREKPVILVPLGSQEEQGPHGPMGDYMLTDAIAQQVATRSGAISAPIMPFGYADYFRPVAGGIALRAETFAMVLEDILVNFLDHGLNHLVILNGHSGNYPLIDQVIRKLKRSRGVIIPCLNLWRLMTPEIWRQMHGDDYAATQGHGAEPLTSVYKHLFPDLVREDMIELEDSKGEFLGLPTEGLNAVRFQGTQINVPLDVTERCGNGITGGDPYRASADIGARITEHLVTLAAEFVVHFRQQATTSGGGKS